MCRQLSTLLHSGVAIDTAFELAAGKTGDLRCRRSMVEIRHAIREGMDISAAMQAQGRYFPDLLIDMVRVAEDSGELPEVLAGLADHYENNLRLRKEFLTGIAWPAFQLVAAIFVIALVILIMGLIPGASESRLTEGLTFGLSGPEGAIIWLLCTFGSMFALFVGYQVLVQVFKGKDFLDPLLMKVPVLGKCMRSFAIARFCWTFYLTQQTGMPITESLKASLRATTNGAFIGASRSICEEVQEGADLTTALRNSELFPEDFLQMVHVGETSGTVPEQLHRLSPQFEDDARRSLAALTAALGWLVWLIVGVFIVLLIFRFMLRYVDLIQKVSSGDLDAL